MHDRTMQDAPTTEIEIDAALRLRSQGRWRQMIETLEPMRQGGVTSARLLALLAEAYLLGGRQAEADGVLREALALSPTDDLVQAALARSMIRRGDFTGALAAAEIARRRSPQQPDHALLAAAIYGAMGRPAEASPLIDAVLAAYPDLAAAHARQAFHLLALGRRAEALLSARRAFSLGFSHPDTFRLLHSVGDQELAVEALRRRLAVDPSDGLAMIAIGELLRAPAPAEALTWFERATQVRPRDADAWGGLGVALHECGRGEEARAAYEHALSLAPGAPNWTTNLAALDLAAGRYEAAADALRPLAQAGRLDPNAHSTLTRVVAALGGDVDLTGFLESVLASEPTNGSVLRELGRTGEAAAVYQQEAAKGRLTAIGLQEWLGLVACDPALGDALAIYDRWAGVAGGDVCDAACLAALPLVSRWANGDLAAVERLLPHAKNIELADSKFQVPARFFSFVEGLAAFRRANPNLYSASPETPEVQVIGESHVLSSANLQGTWRNAPARFRPRFIMGAKMHGLGGVAYNLYRALLDTHLKAAPEDAELLFTVGEIDCRPDEGMWPVHRRTGRALASIVHDTVDRYLGNLDSHLAGRSWRGVTVSGAPAPGYAGLRLPHPPPAFVEMFSLVNARLATGAAERGWGFLDVHAATAGPDGLGNRRWHIDGYHLRPDFYAAAADEFRRPGLAG